MMFILLDHLLNGVFAAIIGTAAWFTIDIIRYVTNKEGN